MKGSKATLLALTAMARLLTAVAASCPPAAQAALAAEAVAGLATPAVSTAEQVLSLTLAVWECSCPCPGCCQPRPFTGSMMTAWQMALRALFVYWPAHIPCGEQVAMGGAVLLGLDQDVTSQLPDHVLPSVLQHALNHKEPLAAACTGLAVASLVNKTVSGGLPCAVTRIGRAAASIAPQAKHLPAFQPVCMLAALFSPYMDRVVEPACAAAVQGRKSRLLLTAQWPAACSKPAAWTAHQTSSSRPGWHWPTLLMALPCVAAQHFCCSPSLSCWTLAGQLKLVTRAELGRAVQRMQSLAAPARQQTVSPACLAAAA